MVRAVEARGQLVSRNLKVSRGASMRCLWRRTALGYRTWATKGGLHPAGMAKERWEALDLAARRRVHRAVVEGRCLDSPAEASAALELAQRRRRYLLGPRQNTAGLFAWALLLVFSLVRLATGTVDRLAIEGAVMGALFLLLNLNSRRLARNAARAIEANHRARDE